jgi:hypothetical protein
VFSKQQGRLQIRLRCNSIHLKFHLNEMAKKDFLSFVTLKLQTYILEVPEVALMSLNYLVAVSGKRYHEAC